MENLPGQFLLTTDKAGKIRFSSGLGRTHFRDNSSVLGKHYRILIGGERDGEQTLDELLREVCSGRPWAGMQWHSREDGQRFPVEVFASPHRDPESGRIVGALIVGRDISSQQRWRDRAEISEPLAQIGQLSSRIAREMEAGLDRLEKLVCVRLGCFPSGGRRDGCGAACQRRHKGDYCYPVGHRLSPPSNCWLQPDNVKYARGFAWGGLAFCWPARR